MSAVRFKPRSYPCIHTDEVADCLNRATGGQQWTTQKVRRWLCKHSAAFKRGSQWVTTARKLRENLPEFWEVMLPYLVVEDDEDDEAA